jgi:hypothetical protein
MGARIRVGIGLSYWPARARICKKFRSLGIDSKESISARLGIDLWALLKVYELGSCYVGWRN